MLVLDLTQYIAGPFCTRLLADYGADVVKIERPWCGDGARRLGPFPGDISDPERSGQFLYLNTNKRGVTLNLKSQAGADALRRLVAQADVLVESFRPGTMARLGLHYGALRQLNPRLLYCSISNFGQSGPYRDLAATELILEAIGGYAYVYGDPARAPLGLPFPVAQYVAGVHGYIAILAAEALRARTDTGQHLDVSIMEALLALQDPMLAMYCYSGTERGRVGRHREDLYPSTIMPCRDGFILLQAVTNREWHDLLGLIGRADLVDDPRFANARARVQNGDAIDAIFAPWVAGRDAAEIYHTAQARRIPLAVVASPKDVLESAHLASRGYFREVVYPDGLNLTLPGLPFRRRGAAQPVTAPAPRLGEHDFEVFGGLLGMTSGDIAALGAV